MNKSTPMIHLGEQWWLLNENRLSAIEPEQNFSKTHFIISDFNNAIHGLETISGPVEHAKALVEKQLRDAGLLDGPGKILIHDTRKIGDAISVVFTAVPTELYADYFEKIVTQKDHCLVIPLMAVLTKYCLSIKEKNFVFVFHYEKQFDLIIVINGHIKVITRLTSYSESKADIKSTLSTLTTEISHYTDKHNAPIISLYWASFKCSQADLDFYQQNLSDSTGLDIKMLSHQDRQIEHEKIKSSLPIISEHISENDAANSFKSQFLYKSEKILPLVAVIFFVLISLALATIWKWNTQISNYKSQINQSNKSQLEAQIDTIKQDLRDSNLKFSKNKHAKKISQWIYALDGIQIEADPKQLINDIGSALTKDIQVVAIQYDTQSKPAKVIIEGIIEKPLKFALNDLEKLSSALLLKGYSMLSNSSIELSDNNDFRLTLKIGGTDE